MGGVERGDDVASFALFSFQSFPKPGCQASFPRPPIRDVRRTNNMDESVGTGPCICMGTIHPLLPTKTEFALIP